MPKHRAGLHKKISSIFDGVPIQGDNGAQQPAAAAPERPNYEGRPEHNKECFGAPSHATATAPEPPLPPKAAAPKRPSDFAQGRPKTDTAVKTAGQILWRQSLERLKNKLFASKPGVSATKQKTMAILVPVLSIVLIFVLTQILSTLSPKSTEAGSFRPSNVIAGPVDKIDWQIPAPYPTTLRDPMQFGQVTAARAGTGRLIVKGIVYSEDKASAVIDGQIMHEGDKVLNVTIVRINKNSVEFEMNGKRWTQKVQR